MKHLEEVAGFDIEKEWAALPREEREFYEEHLARQQASITRGAGFDEFSRVAARMILIAARISIGSGYQMAIDLVLDVCDRFGARFTAADVARFIRGEGFDKMPILSKEMLISAAAQQARMKESS